MSDTGEDGVSVHLNNSDPSSPADKGAWRDDARAFRDTCRRLNLPAALERSRSGRGAHVWLFFAEAVPAPLARRLGSHILTETMEGRPDVGLDSYDRLFPNQDTLPQGGFGNLIALPLQKGPRGQGHSLFLDDQFEPWADQCAMRQPEGGCKGVTLDDCTPALCGHIIRHSR